MTFSNCCIMDQFDNFRPESTDMLTSLSNTQPFNARSCLLHCHSCWLLFSRHCQCVRNCSRQFLFTSSSLPTDISIQLAHLRLAHCHQRWHRPSDSHARSTSGNFSSLLKTFKLSSSIRSVFAHHVVVIIGFASGADEVARTEQWSGRCPDFGRPVLLG